jgi:tetratricopeptide (TPR) repeat protein
LKKVFVNPQSAIEGTTDMSQLQERIAQFRKMANDDPDNELGHFRLGQLLVEAQQHEEAVKSFRRALEINPQFSKVHQLLGASLIALGRHPEAITVLKEGYVLADELGNNIPRDEMARMLRELGQSLPETRKKAPAAAGGPGDGFRCQRPGCPFGTRARRLDKAPMNDELGQRIQESVCADCWNWWLRDVSIKVINEMRLDLSTPQSQEMYDRVLRETLGLA